ncbi:sh3 domain protein [Podospora didyma]|uniref:Sh3 domain protein n=1 Tax=Podospora didyma TaxID=330526 RepID=A0AAE0KDS3_9PEZI|nr:sh3 domain protein [Podospora didyma]
MTRPEIIRADTIDLQARDGPTAQAHHKPVPDALGLLAPHQAETLREVAAETAEDQLHSPRPAWNGESSDPQQLQQKQQTGPNTMQAGSQQDALAIAQNGGIEADDDLDGETEVDMDDDMMDKISSSPSIEDGEKSSSMNPKLGDDHNHFANDGNDDNTSAISTTPLHRTEPRAIEEWPPGRALNGTNDHEVETDADVEDMFEDRLPGINEHVTNDKCREDEIYQVYEYDEDYDDGDDFPIEDPRFRDSGWGDECLQDTEDIDFEFVYALHTFVATVEGQANATKGDNMVLLDDSNSYWWLVRIVKDSSIGYLPAEHIETPTERLARLNKHRNIDLSQTMLGDQAEKSRNPLKSAIKRRKAKTVQFAPPTFVDYSDNDFSSEEEDAEAEYFAQQQQQLATQAAGDAEIEDETAKVEPLKPRLQLKEAAPETVRQEAGVETDGMTTGKVGIRNSEEIFETKAGDGPKKTSDGTVRDSFFKDDTVETRKITLTPNLLRDDNAPRTSADSRDLKQRVSLDKLDKDSPPGKDDKKKRDKKEKEKKPSAFRSLFSRKDKKAKGEEDDDSFGKPSMDVDYQDREMEEEEVQASPEKSQGPQRNPSKLQKQQPRIEPSPTRKSTITSPKDSGMDIVTILSEGKVNNVANVPPASMRIVNPGMKESPEGSPRDQRVNRDQSPEATRTDDKFGAPRIAMSRAPAEDVQPQKTMQAKSRVELDDFDSDEDITPQPARQAPIPEAVLRQQQQQQQYYQQQSQQQRSAQSNFSDSYQLSQSAPVGPTAELGRSVPVNTTPPQQHVERLSESPIEVSPISNPPPLMGDTSSQEEDRSSTRSSPSPDLIEHDDGDTLANQDSMTTSTSTATASTWNDVNLRAFFDSGSDIRDLLVVVYDKSDVTPVGPEHPIAGTLFKEQNAKLAEITTQLDNMLGDWLARKQRLRGSV